MNSNVVVLILLTICLTICIYKYRSSLVGKISIVIVIAKIVRIASSIRFRRQLEIGRQNFEWFDSMNNFHRYFDYTLELLVVMVCIIFLRYIKSNKT